MTGRTFIFREDWFEFLDDLTQKQQDNVIRAVYCHAFGREIGKLSQAEKVAFNCIKGAVDRDMEKFEERKAKNRENGKKGGRPRSEKTQNNPEKPNGFGDFQSVSNPIPNPIIHNSFFSSSPSPSSNDSVSVGGEESEGKEERKIISYFFFEKKFLHPENELRRLVGFNNMPDRKIKWSDMSAEERANVAVLWESEEQKEAKKAGRASVAQRFPGGLLEFWHAIFKGLISCGAPEEILRDALQDSVKLERKPDRVVISCSVRLHEFIENRPDVFFNIIYPIKPIKYKHIPEWSP